MLRWATIDHAPLLRLLAGYGLSARLLAPEAAIPGSYWGECEAGLRGDTLYVRPDTPLHSVLHEAAHYICMSAERRAGLDRDAGGDDAEEVAVCYLQVLLSGELPGIGRERQLADMDSWGYSFRLGSAARWFQEDAVDARDWLLGHGIIDTGQRLTGRRRE